MKRILLAGGGTGGHIYPGLAIADALGRLNDTARVFFACTNRPIDERILAAVQSVTIIKQPIAPFSARPVGLARFATRWLGSGRLMTRTLREHRIDAVLGLGGFGSSAALAAAGRCRIRRAIFNPDAVPGKANRFFGKRVDAVFVQWPATADRFDRPVRVVGCPLRAGITQLATAERQRLRNEAVKTFDLDDQSKTLFVWGGSTGARSINQAVLKALDDLPDDIQILHMAGRHDFESVRRRYSQHTPRRHRVVEYIDRLELALAVADVAVGRAGAVGLAELAAAAVPAVLMPYPYHRDHHQRANADVLAHADGAVLIDDDGRAGEHTVTALAAALRDLFADPARRQRMSQRLRELSSPRADEEIAQWLMAADDSTTSFAGDDGIST